MLFKTLVDSLYWTIIVEVFFFMIDLFSAKNFSEQTYTVFGFLIIYVYVAVIIYVLRGISSSPKK